MKIQTKYLGEMEVDDTKTIQFSAGLPGFVEETEFVILDLPDNPVFQILQSVRKQDVAFIVTNPYNFYRDYTFDIDESVQESLQIESEKEVVVLSIVTLSKPFENSTLNLKAPVIINSTSNIGKQYILNMDDYPSKASITPSVTTGVKGE